MKKHLLSFLLLSALFSSIKAQDIITKTDGETIECTIIEVTLQLVSFKKIDDTKDPISSFWRKNVKKIEYEDGRVEFLHFQAAIDSNQQIIPLRITKGTWGLNIMMGEQQLSYAQVRSLYTEHPKALAKYDGGKFLRTTGVIVLTPSTLLLTIGIGAVLTGENINMPVVAASGVGVIFGILMMSSGNSAIKKSVKIYNSEIENKKAFSINLALSQDGFGISMKF